MKTIEYHIETITNLHVGSGEANFGVVDRLIQKDAATGFPNVNASSIKGALRELFEAQTQQDNEKNIETIFGSKPNDDKNREAGLFRFFDAYLLGMPVRCDKVPFLMGTCPRLIRDYFRFCRLFGCGMDENITKAIEQILNKVEEHKPLVLAKNYNEALIEDLENKATHYDVKDKKEQKDACNFLNTLLKKPVVLFTDQEFLCLCNEDHLPVIARNNLTKDHENLWYEQVLPRFSILYTFVMMPEGKDIKAQEDFFNGMLNKAGVVQLGANATVGYGYCKFTKKNNPNASSL